MTGDTRDIHRTSKARLQFTASANGETYLSDQHVGYPMHITRPFYLENDPPGMPTVYLQSVSGGLFGGDVIHLTITVNENAQAQVTTQAGTVVHSMKPQQHATQHITIDARINSLFEFISDPLILFPESKLNQRIQLNLSPDATVVLTDSFVIHDPTKSNSIFRELSNEVIIKYDHKVGAVDRFRVAGDTFTDLAPFKAHGTLIIATKTDQERLAQRLHNILPSAANKYGGCSILPNDAGLSVRLMATDTHQLRTIMTKCWCEIRSHLTGLMPNERKK